MRIFKALAPAVVLGCILSLSFLFPESGALTDSSMKQELPLRGNLPGWWATKKQESKEERILLSKDTIFSKADYELLERLPGEKKLPTLHVSLVFSGNDLNNSIHRPERCLPAQGHVNLHSSVQTLHLNDGRAITLTRLASHLPSEALPDKKLNFIHYYVFVGHGNLCHTHLQRTAIDIKDRILGGDVQRWAYFQIGTYWSPYLHTSEQEADQMLQKLICSLLPVQIKWEEIDAPKSAIDLMCKKIIDRL